MRQAMIFAAGLGTRLRPLTDSIPKALVPVGGKPLLWHVLMRLKAAGFERLVVNVHHFASQIVDYLRENDNFGLDVRISDESGRLLETGGGIRKALPFFDSTAPVLIHNVDILSNVDLSAFYDSVDDSGIISPDALLLVSQRQTKRYLLFDDSSRLVGWTNIETKEIKSPYPHLDVKQQKMFAFSGIHLVAPSLFPLLADGPERFPIMDFYLQHCAQVNIMAKFQPDLRLLDVGKVDTLADAEKFLSMM